jgi:hypothetical protein
MDVFYPIIDDISTVALAGHSSISPADQTIVGVVVVSIYWRETIRNILPPGSNGIIVVISNACTDSFSYKLMGPDVQYLGVGDRHDSIYDSLSVGSTVIDLNSFTQRISKYTGAPINKDYCPYMLRVYPSDEMKSEFTTQDAIIFMISVLLVFAFTSLVFLLYDWRVERRQHRVMSTALRSSAIVSSLFPSAVRDQLYPSQQEHGNIRTTSIDTVQETGASPIAQVYPETTVIFADIVGFTAWSSARQPTQVFHLLETLYAGFDALAKFHGVFKIETIGDSYVAVVGLPRSRERHAVVMAKFANDCRRKMVELTEELETFLGSVRIKCVLL